MDVLKNFLFPKIDLKRDIIRAKIWFPYERWRIIKSETRPDAEILVRNPSSRLFGEKFRDSKKVKTNREKRDFETYQKRFRDFEILPKFSETHVFRGTIRHPSYGKRLLANNMTGQADVRLCKLGGGWRLVK